MARNRDVSGQMELDRMTLMRKQSKTNWKTKNLNGDHQIAGRSYIVRLRVGCVAAASSKLTEEQKGFKSRPILSS